MSNSGANQGHAPSHDERPFSAQPEAHVAAEEATSETSQRTPFMASSVVMFHFDLSWVVAEAITRPIGDRPATAIQADRRAAFACLISIFFTFGSPPLAAFFKRSNSPTRKSTSLSMSGTAVRQAISPKSRLSK